MHALIRPLTLACVLAACAPAFAGPDDKEKEPIETDRPDITETSNVVGRGRFQLETSILREFHRGRRSDERSLFTPTLLRLGLNDRWEARLETDGYSRTRSFSAVSGVSRTSGYSTLAPGVKYHFQDPREGSMRPSLGAILHLNVPSGSSDFGTDRITGDLKLAADWDLAPKWAFGANLALVVDEDDTGRVFTSGLVTGALARELTSRLRTYVELVLQAPERRSGGRGVILDGGFAYLLDLDTQIDFGIGTGLSGRSTPDLFWTVGFSKRF